MLKQFTRFLLFVAGLLTLMHNVVPHCHEHAPELHSQSLLHSNHAELPFVFHWLETIDQGEGHLEEMIPRISIHLKKSENTCSAQFVNLGHKNSLPEICIQEKTGHIYHTSLPLLNGNFLRLDVRPPPSC